MMLAHTIPSCHLRTADPEDYHRELGEAWEDILADNLTAKGLPSYRPHQCFIPATDLKRWREFWQFCLDLGDYADVSCSLNYRGQAPSARAIAQPNFQPHPSYEVLPGCPNIDRAILRPHQRDLLVKIGKVKRLSVEVKALCPAAFRQHMVQVGCCPKYDLKQFRIDALIPINQETAEAYVAPEPDTWQKQKSKVSSNELCYAVPNHLLTPLEAWIDFVKKSYNLVV